MIMAQHQCESYGTRSIFHKIILLKIFYVPQINQSPTSTSLVSETMSRSLKIPLECQKGNIFVTYNLAIEKLALQIQAERGQRSIKFSFQKWYFFLSWEKSLKNQVVLIFWMNTKFWRKCN